MQIDELGFFLKIAKSAAMKAGKFLYQHIGVEQTILLNEGRDIKLQLDADAEGIIKDYLEVKKVNLQSLARKQA